MGWRGGERSGRFSCVERIGWMEGRWWIIREGGWRWSFGLEMGRRMEE